MPYLFSYGTLQKEKVQLETFGRLLEGDEDTLTKYSLKMVEIKNPEVLRKSGEKFHPIIRYSGNDNDKIKGILFKVSTAEIAKADEYEVDNYKRVKVTFTSGKKGYIYVERNPKS